MTMKKTMKIIVALLLAILLVMTLSQIAFADANIALDTFDNVSDDSGAKSSVTNIIGRVIDIARVIGAGVAIIMLIVLAIQYISASPEGKAELKKTATIYIVGAIVLFAATGILSVIKKFALNSIDVEKNS